MKKLIISLFLLLSFCGLFITVAKADQIQDINEKIAQYQKEIENLQGQQDTLNKQISLMDNQIKVTTIRISQTEVQIKTLEEEIKLLAEKIVRLDGSLDHLSKVLLSRVTETYKSAKYGTLELILSSKDFSDFISRSRYLQVVQAHDRQLLLSMEQTRTNYDEQKQLKEKKQTELEKLQKQLISQKEQLSSQIADRKRLLEDTKGKEANYQKMLAMARAELTAISGILAGEGKEVEVKKVTEGEKIASLIDGESCNSSGTHLHFIVDKDGQTQNPFQYLKGGITYENCSGPSCGSGGDSFDPKGNWEWPLNPKIILTQGYGYTWSITHTWVGRIYKFHNGIDIQGSSLEIKAPKKGTLYRGSFSGGCTLRYVKVHHDEDNIDTYYLHVNY